MIWTTGGSRRAFKTKDVSHHAHIMNPVAMTESGEENLPKSHDKIKGGLHTYGEPSASARRQGRTPTHEANLHEAQSSTNKRTRGGPRNTTCLHQHNHGTWRGNRNAELVESDGTVHRSHVLQHPPNISTHVSLST